jgi:hypothetical protein
MHAEDAPHEVRERMVADIGRHPAHAQHALFPRRRGKLVRQKERPGKKAFDQPRGAESRQGHQVSRWDACACSKHSGTHK